MLKPVTKEAYQLLMEGQICFSRIEAAGLRIDVPYLDSAIHEIRGQIIDMQNALKTSKEYKVWAKVYGDRMKLGSKVQLGTVMFKHMGHKRNPHAVSKSNKDKYNNDEHAFEHLNCPFVKNYFGIAKLEKALSTYLLGIKREVVDGYVHPFQHLFRAMSYRSSSSDPNFHNMPVRNKSVSKIIRSSVIPRSGHIFLEPDYGAQEVRVSACYHKDPRLIDYILGGGDMHLDRALELYCLTKEEIDDGMSRYCAKNKFVFPQFYGSTHVNCAPDLWEAISLMKLKTKDGVSLFNHLKKKGIKKLGTCDYEQEPQKGTFELHVKKIQDHMWNDVLTVYNQWKKDWWLQYQTDGGVNFLSGFKMEGIFDRNQILCSPIQGSAFHCLLWSLVQMQKWMIKKRMKTKIVDQIHDSGLFDTHRREKDDVIEKFTQIATKDVAEHFPWICIPLLVEWKMSETNWFDMKGIA